MGHISNGRAGWNLVTTYPKGSFDNFGRFHGISHWERYVIGEKAYSVVMRFGSQNHCVGTSEDVADEMPE